MVAGQAQIGHQGRQDHGIEHDVEGMSIAAERGGKQGPPASGEASFHHANRVISGSPFR